MILEVENFPLQTNLDASHTGLLSNKLIVLFFEALIGVDIWGHLAATK